MMSKQKNTIGKTQVSETELGRGKIKDNFLAALVTSKLYKMQVVKAKKGKGSYQRKAKNIRQESYLIAA
ncbi:alternative ribosome-rescue factor A [Paraglaciecola polaris]|uniref:alternative ribosome-rescue factor A n=1 Tax=Paraglaciecola polaris TaxID=222814 RepID=UPI003AB957B1|tara:strand:- start:3014 stop:3220 length:207 start_codon:yes stop_codon:yes gene_type:complete